MTCHGVAAPAAQSNRRTVGGVANRLGFSSEGPFHSPRPPWRFLPDPFAPGLAPAPCLCLERDI